MTSLVSFIQRLYEKKLYDFSAKFFLVRIGGIFKQLRVGIEKRLRTTKLSDTIFFVYILQRASFHSYEFNTITACRESIRSTHGVDCGRKCLRTSNISNRCINPSIYTNVRGSLVRYFTDVIIGIYFYSFMTEITS